MPKWKIVSSRPPKILPRAAYSDNKEEVWIDAGIIVSVADIPFDQIPCSQNPPFRGWNSIGTSQAGTLKPFIETDGSCPLACRPDVTPEDFEWIKG